MKLLIITAVEEFEEKIKKMLIKSNTLSFSYFSATGYKNTTQDSVPENWFGTRMNENDSVIFLAFVPKENTDEVIESVQKFNDSDEFSTRIHVAIVNLEKTI